MKLASKTHVASKIQEDKILSIVSSQHTVFQPGTYLSLDIIPSDDVSHGAKGRDQDRWKRMPGFPKITGHAQALQKAGKLFWETLPGNYKVGPQDLQKQFHQTPAHTRIYYGLNLVICTIRKIR